MRGYLGDNVLGEKNKLFKKGESMMTAKQRECHEQFAKDRVEAIKREEYKAEVEAMASLEASDQEAEFMMEMAGTAVDNT